MADKEDSVEVEGSSGNKKKLILLVIGALLLIGGAVGGTLMFLGGDNQAEPQEDIVEEIVKGDPVYVDLKPPFTVNLDPDDAVGFLQVSMQVLTFNADVAADMEKHKPLIRNNLIVLFGSQKSVDLRASGGKEKLQKDALSVVQSVIDKSGSGGEVDNVFFTTFVMQ
ncbi:MAG: flagellar FliL protein [Chitinophagales bacterium]